jgi:hypothetical protein
MKCITMSVKWLLILILCISSPLWAVKSEPNGVDGPKASVIAPSKSVIQKYQLDPFYKKYLDADGIAVTSSQKVADAALYEVQYLIRHSLQNRPDILKAMSEDNARIAVIGANEEVSKVPEYYIADPKEADRQNKRVRGYGGMPLTSCGEENLLNYDGDRYRGENIFLHEFAHCIHAAMRQLDPDFQDKLKRIYNESIKKGLWEKTYAGSNPGECWAEGVQSYFDCSRPSKGPQPDGVHNNVNTREELKKYDPELFTLIDNTLKSPRWRYTLYIDRPKEKQTDSGDKKTGNL